jgi:hypothetical protein
VKGATACRQFTDCNNKVETSRGVQFVTTRMRQRACHYCDCCMILDPTGRVTGGLKTCQYAELCGNPDNVVQISRAEVTGTRLRSCDLGKAKREEEAKLAGAIPYL